MLFIEQFRSPFFALAIAAETEMACAMIVSAESAAPSLEGKRPKTFNFKLFTFNPELLALCFLL
jgi:hypothetical protein